MRALDLLRVARAAAAAAGPFGCGACSPDLPQRAVTQLTSLLGLQLQQQAGYAAWRRGDESEDDDVAASAKGRHSKLKHSERRQLIQRKLQTQEVEDEELEVTQQRISGLLESLGRGGSEDSASLFVSGFFGPRQPGGEAAASSSSADDAAGSEEDEAAEEVTIEDLRYKGEGGRFAPPTELLSAADQAAAAAAGVADEPEAEMDAEMAAASMEVDLPSALDAEEEVNLLGKLQGLRPGSQRVLLQKMLEGGIMRADPSAMREWEAIQEQFKPPPEFRMKVVDVNRTCKGTRTGGLYRYSSMVVVGNGNGVLGWGQGKAAEVNDSVQKAFQRACRNLYPISRYNDHTITEPMNAKYGQVKVVMYPRASGNGITANALMYEICKMAGLYDIGLKIHGSRNVRNAVKCVFKAFDQMRTEEEIGQQAAAAGKMVVKMPPGRYRHLRL
ncbi:hypothetical protein D9Q98_006373 [Chlorella vulgaris]|uniref:S5 DRBM domain-containing protein n=1 Tax=Chlorella vulgaris TaxID=3077 RepID=A0A9D4TK90_CHLVU|nr:hypothetical protein D9Q98_006373 [Chlorella vulgaris]